MSVYLTKRNSSPHSCTRRKERREPALWTTQTLAGHGSDSGVLLLPASDEPEHHNHPDTACVFQEQRHETGVPLETTRVYHEIGQT